VVSRGEEAFPVVAEVSEAVVLQGDGN